MLHSVASETMSLFRGFLAIQSNLHARAPWRALHVAGAARCYGKYHTASGDARKQRDTKRCFRVLYRLLRPDRRLSSSSPNRHIKIMRYVSKTTLALALGTLLCFSAAAAPCINGNNASGTCEVPAGMTSLTIASWGGGGGGGGAAGDSGNLDGGGGGGGGAYCGATFAVVPGASLNVSVGTGGAGGAYQAAGTGGGASAVSGPGVAGMQADGGAPGAPNTLAGAGGNIAACTATGRVSFSGGNGEGYPFGGGGGGSATSTSNGQGGISGAGGAGEGPGGAGGVVVGFGNGAPGSDPGGGGGGGYDIGGRSGGAGGIGRVTMSFTAAPIAAAPKSIPTLSEWAMLAMSGLVALAGLAAIRRRA